MKSGLLAAGQTKSLRQSSMPVTRYFNNERSLDLGHIVNSATKKKLKSLAHALKPVIIIGQAGLTSAVINETEQALDSHELIKVKIRAERNIRHQVKERLCQQTGAEPIQSIGQVIVIYRKNPSK